MTEPRFYPVAEPHLDDEDRRHLLDAFDSGWISSNGPYVREFEESFARYVGTKFALSVCNGTAALHMTLLALGVKPGDEVIVPTFTYVATANAVAYCGAVPVLVDCEPDTWNLCPRAFRAAVTPKTVGVIPAHLYGHPCDMDAIDTVAREHGLWVLEDAAEAHGASVHGRNAGTFGRAAIFSFYGNKIITTGEGGMITTDDAELARRITLFKGQGMDPDRRYWFPQIGYNARMTNLAAAIGVSQLRKIEELIDLHRLVAHWYAEELRDCADLALPVQRSGVKNVFWLYSVRLLAAEGRPELRDRLMERLAADGIETRPFFYPMHVMPVYRQTGNFETAERTASSGLNLPSSPRLERRDVRHICERLKIHAEALTSGSARAA